VLTNSLLPTPPSQLPRCALQVVVKTFDSLRASTKAQVDKLTQQAQEVGTQ
jgi:hypothetical protein